MMTALEIVKAVSSGEQTAEQITRQSLAKIAELNPSINAFVEVFEADALARAKEIDAKRARGEKLGALAGVPVAIKDNILYKGHKATCCSKMLENYVASYTSTVVEKLLAADAVIVGRANMDEFAMGSTNQTSVYGPVKNPVNLECVPGGSSGGSAAAVAAGMVPVALGTDTGGSVRQPAGFCGVVGIKPGYGRISRYGVIAFASSLDTPGLLAHSAEDCAWVMNEMIEFDPKDSTCVDLPREDFARCLDMSMDGVKIGVPRSWFAKGLDEELAASIEDVIRTYERMGAKIVDIELPTVDLGVPVYYVVACAEASSNLSRYDGVRYGYRAKHYTDIQDMIKRSRSEALGAEPQRRIMIGTYVLSHGYYDAYYIKAQRVRRLIANELNNVCQQVDAIISPAATGPAYRFGEKSDPVQAYLSDLYTVPISLAGLPGMGLPCGLHSNGLPLGFQLVSARFNEAKLLGIAHRYQCETDWHKRVPAGY